MTPLDEEAIVQQGITSTTTIQLRDGTDLQQGCKCLQVVVTVPAIVMSHMRDGYIKAIRQLMTGLYLGQSISAIPATVTIGARP